MNCRQCYFQEGYAKMIHYSCDRCRKTIDPDTDLRYVVRVEVQAAFDQCDVDDDRDHLLEIQDILERVEDMDDEEIGEEIYQRRRFDLCSDCQKVYLNNPLGLETQMQVEFSEN